MEIVFAGLKPGEIVDSISLLRYNRITKHVPILVAETVVRRRGRQIPKFTYLPSAIRHPPEERSDGTRKSEP